MQRKSFGKMACPIARSLERVGEWWSILIIRDALHGFTRFDEFQKSLNIAPNMLTRRLSALVDAGLLERRRYSERPPRYEYILTEMGRDFRPVIVAMFAWGNRHFAPEGASVLLVDKKTRESGRSRTGRSAERKTAQRARLCVCRRPCRQQAHTPPLRSHQSETIRGAAVVETGARQKAQGVMITAARRQAVIAAPIAERRAPPRAAEVDSRTRELLRGAIVPTLLRLAWPNILVMLAQASTGLIETWWVSHLGTDALAGMALVFPVVMLMQMVSAGAMGGGISSAVARALGAGRRDEADALVLHAIVVNVALGAFFSIVMLVFGPSIYRALGGTDGELQTALSYSNVVFAGNVLLWLMNALASVIRGTGNMLVPAMVICAGVIFLVPLSPCLIFGVGPFPELGVAGAGVALVLFYAAGTAVLLWYILSGRNLARLRLTALRWPLFRDILAVGAVAAITSLQTNVTIALATALVASASGTNAVAGYGTGVRLEYLLYR